MKSSLLLLMLIILTNCNPASPIFIKNETGNNVRIIVSYENRFNLKFDSLRCTNKPVETYKLLRRDSLEGKIPIEKYDTDKYLLQLENNITILLEPRTFGIPIKEIVCQSQFYNDTISNAYRYRPNHYLASRFKIERKGLYTHLIILK